MGNASFLEQSTAAAAALATSTRGGAGLRQGGARSARLAGQRVVVIDAPGVVQLLRPMQSERWVLPTALIKGLRVPIRRAGRWVDGLRPIRHDPLPITQACCSSTWAAPARRAPPAAQRPNRQPGGGGATPLVPNESTVFAQFRSRVEFEVRGSSATPQRGGAPHSSFAGKRTLSASWMRPRPSPVRLGP